MFQTLAAYCYGENISNYQQHQQLTLAEQYKFLQHLCNQSVLAVEKKIATPWSLYKNKIQQQAEDDNEEGEYDLDSDDENDDMAEQMQIIASTILSMTHFAPFIQEEKYFTATIIWSKTKREQILHAMALPQVWVELKQAHDKVPCTSDTLHQLVHVMDCVTRWFLVCMDDRADIMIDPWQVKVACLSHIEFVHFVFHLCYSYHDALRIAAIECALTIARVAPDMLQDDNKLELLQRLDKEIVQQYAIDYYFSRFDAQVWIPLLGKHTFATKSIHLSQEEAQAIVHTYESTLWTSMKQQDPQDAIRIENLQCKIQCELDTHFGGKAFIKLSTRAPKDAIFVVPWFIDAFNQVKQELIDKQFIANEEQLPTTTHNAILQIAGAKSMHVNASQFITLLLKSHRSYIDLQRALDQQTTLQVMIREWKNIAPWFEVRAFVRQNRLTCMSQYFSMCHFAWISAEMWQQVQQSISNYFDNHICALLSVMYDHYVIDFGLDESTQHVHVIEINPFGSMSGAALFDWKKDATVMYNGSTTTSTPPLRRCLY